MAVEMVHAIDGLAGRVGKRFARRDPDDQAADEPGAPRDGNAVDLLDGRARRLERVLHGRRDQLNVLAPGDLGHDAAVFRVKRILARRDAGTHARAVLDDRDRRVVARGLDSEEQHGRFSAPPGDALGQLVDEGADGDGRTFVLDTALVDGDRAFGRFLLADDEDIGHLLELPVANLVAELFVRFVDLDAEAVVAQRLGDLARVVELMLADRRHDGLHGRQPRGERAGEVYDEHAEEALHRAG